MPTTQATKDEFLNLVTNRVNWIIPLTAAPAAKTAAAIHAVRFSGSAPVSIVGVNWAAPTGNDLARQITNAAEIAFAATAGLVGPTKVSHYAVARTTSDAIPNAGTTFGNITQVVDVGALTRELTFGNGALPRFPAGTIVLEARDPQ